MSHKSHLYTKEPIWFCRRLKGRLNIPESTMSWLYETGSITQRLRHYYGSDVGVQVLSNQWCRGFVSEHRLLHIPITKYALNREVLLFVDETPLVLARTIIPLRTVRSAQQNLSHLGSRPLGEVIFSYPKLERLALEVSEVPLSLWHKEIKKKIKISGRLWGRRTIYAIHRQPILVSEFFLPEVLGH